MTVVARKIHREKAAQIGKFLLSSEVILTKVDTLVFEKAWKLFQATDNLSFTDCTSAAFTQIFEIERIATFDKGFKNIKNIEVIDN